LTLDGLTNPSDATSPAEEGGSAMMVGGWSMGWMWIWPVLIVCGLAVIGYVAVRLARGGTAGSPNTAGPPSSQARRILDERYARGEIDDEEYRHRRGELS
jgi:putative membrane protein